MDKMPGMNHGGKERLAMMNKMPDFSGKKNTPPRQLFDFFANTGDNPLYAGFKNEVGVHAGMSGKPLMRTEALWSKVKDMDDQSPRRALYVHTPFCLSRCKFCSFYHSRTNAEELELYAELLLKELEIVAESHFVTSSPIDAVYFGGGTPTDHSPSSLKKLLHFIINNFNLTEDCEITIEGRLHGFDDEKVSACIENGVNRFSFGIQSFDSRVRQQMGRIDKCEKLLSRLDEIAKTSDNIISVDLIYGLPDQSSEIWLNDLETVANGEAIDSCSIYNLKSMPGTPLDELVTKGKISSPASKEEQADLFMVTRDFFNKRNALRPSLRHWAFSPHERSLYNILSKYEQTCIPIGAGAGGMAGGYRFFQTMNIADYSSQVERGDKPIAMAFEAEMDNDILGAIPGNLEEKLSLNFNELFANHDIQYMQEKFRPLLEQWQEAGMVEYDYDENKITLTAAGEFYNVNISQNLIDYYRLVRRTPTVDQ